VRLGQRGARQLQGWHSRARFATALAKDSELEVRFRPVALGSLAKPRLRVRIRSSRFAIYRGADSALMVSALSLAANVIKASVTLAF